MSLSNAGKEHPLTTSFLSQSDVIYSRIRGEATRGEREFERDGVAGAKGDLGIVPLGATLSSSDSEQKIVTASRQLKHEIEIKSRNEIKKTLAMKFS